jgi:hypothetical protein
LTVRHLLETLHGFYATHLTAEDLADRDDDEPGDDPYLDDASKPVLMQRMCAVRRHLPRGQRHVAHPETGELRLLGS